MDTKENYYRQALKKVGLNYDDGNISRKSGHTTEEGY